MLNRKGVSCKWSVGGVLGRVSITQRVAAMTTIVFVVISSSRFGRWQQDEQRTIATQGMA